MNFSDGLLACFFFLFFFSSIAWIFLLFSAKCLVLEGMIAWFIVLHTHPSVFGVGQVVPLWWINWAVHLWLLLVLLLCKNKYVRLHANLLFLWLHGLCLLWLLPHAWQYWVPCFLVFCPPHLWFNQVRLASHIHESSLTVSLMLQVKQWLAGKSAPGSMESHVTTFENAGKLHVGHFKIFYR